MIEPTPMLREVAAAITSVREHVTAIGATAMHIALSEDRSVVTPTFDVDLALSGGKDASENVRRVVNALKSADLAPSEEAGEAGFTWLGAVSKVQLISGFAPIRKGALRRIPAQPGIEDFLVGRIPIAFSDRPDALQLYCVDPASLLGL